MNIESMKMIRRFLCAALMLLVSALCNFPGLAYAADETLIATFLAKRQAFVAENRIDIGQMSKAIRAAIADSEQLEREGK